MPILAASDESVEIRVKTVYQGDVMITYIMPNITLDELCSEMKDICRFANDQVCPINF